MKKTTTPISSIIKLLSLFILNSIVFNSAFAQIKVLKSGRVAIGSNNIDTAYKAAIDGSNVCALSLFNNHTVDYQWSMISHVNRSLSKCYIVDLDSAHTFYVTGSGQAFCKSGLYSEGTIIGKSGAVIDGDLNVNGKINAVHAIRSNKSVSSPNIFSKIGAWIRSDSSVKYDLQNINSALEKLQQLNGYTYKYKKDSSNANMDSSLNGRYYGFIAQDILNILPEVVSRPDSDSVYYVNYGQMVALLVEGIKEMNTKIDSLGNVLASLEQSNLTMQNNYQDLFNQVQTLQQQLNNCCPPTFQQSVPQNSAHSDITNSFSENNINAQPNPFSKFTELKIQLAEKSKNKPVQIVITDLTGKIIKRLDMPKFKYSIEIAGNELTEGMYYCTLLVDQKIAKTIQILHN